MNTLIIISFVYVATFLLVFVMVSILKGIRKDNDAFRELKKQADETSLAYDELVQQTLVNTAKSIISESVTYALWCEGSPESLCKGAWVHGIITDDVIQLDTPGSKVSAFPTLLYDDYNAALTDAEKCMYLINSLTHPNVMQHLYGSNACVINVLKYDFTK